MLALRMGRTIGELMETMSSQEFSIWAALFKEDQWGEARDDLRVGKLCAVVGNYAGKVRPERSDPLCAADFFPNLLGEPAKVSEPDPIAHFSAVAASQKLTNLQG